MRVELLMEHIAAERCGLDQSRGMLTIYAASVRDMHRLAERLLRERGRFRRMPDHLTALRQSTSTTKHQLKLELDSS